MRIMFACYVYKKVVICPNQDSMGNVAFNRMVGDILTVHHLLPMWSMLVEEITNYLISPTVSQMVYNFSNTDNHKIKYNL
jgi:hypothetical protein